MIGFLRCLGVLNAAVWFGSIFFFTFVAAPGLGSTEVEKLLGGTHAPFFAGAIAQLLRERQANVQLICAVVALLHLLGERLYFGKTHQRFSGAVLGGLIALALLASFWVDPKLGKLNTARYAVNTNREIREAAARSFDTWHGVWQAINVFTIAGLGFYVCGVGRRED